MSPRVALCLVIGVLAVSWAAIFVRLADAPPLTIAAWRLCLAGALVFPYAWLGHRAELRRTSTRVRWFLLGSGVALALHFGTWITSLKLTSVASSVALVTTTPVWVALLSALLLKEKARALTLVAMAVAIGGSLLIAGADFGLDARALQGDALALAGAIFGAIYLTIGRHARAQLGLVAYIGVVYPIAGVCLLGAAALAGDPLVAFPAETWLLFAALALVPQLLGHSLFNWALKHTSAGLVAIAILGEPVFSTLLAIPILHETPGWTRAVGAAVVLGGVGLAAWSESRRASLLID
ncbi:MAG: permease [Myxococcaceae bacterium]|nr:permease [Myxococcaceae bacterium]